MNLFKLRNLIAHTATLLLVAILISASPLSHTKVVHVQKVEALGGLGAVTIVEDVSKSSLITSVKSSISAVANAAVQVYQYDQWVKENILDPLFWGLANALISQMLQSLTAWVNSGFNGSPAFITNIEDFLLDVADDAFGRFVEEIGYGFLCSPFELDIKIALNLQYYADDYEPQCTLSDITDNIESFVNGNFSEGGWAGWFELTQGAHNDPNRSFFETTLQQNAIVLRTRDGEFELLKENKFFKNIQVCEEGVSLNGSIENCTITTPGYFVQTQFNQYLDIPNQKLAFADEFNELIGAVLGQFASTLFTGVGGLLSSGGNSTFRNENAAGLTRTQQLQAATEAEAATGVGGSDGLIRDAVETQTAYRSIMQQTVNFVNNQENRIIAAEAQYPGCFNLSLPAQFTTARNNAQFDIVEANGIIEDLNILKTAYENADTTQGQLDISTEVRRLQSGSSGSSQIKVAQAEIDLDIRLREVALNNFNDDFQAEVSNCNSSP